MKQLETKPLCLLTEIPNCSQEVNINITKNYQNKFLLIHYQQPQCYQRAQPNLSSAFAFQRLFQPRKEHQHTCKYISASQILYQSLSVVNKQIIHQCFHININLMGLPISKMLLFPRAVIIQFRSVVNSNAGLNLSHHHISPCAVNIVSSIAVSLVCDEIDGGCKVDLERYKHSWYTYYIHSPLKFLLGF